MRRFPAPLPGAVSVVLAAVLGVAAIGGTAAPAAAETAGSQASSTSRTATAPTVDTGDSNRASSRQPAAEKKSAVKKATAGPAKKKKKKPLVKKKPAKPTAPKFVRSTVRTIAPTTFGIHTWVSRPEANAGTYRLNCSPLWSKMNPESGVYDWEQADFWMDRAEQEFGYSDILFSFCGTPEWAGTEAPYPNVTPYYGGRSASPPRDMADWRRFLLQFVQRYAARIDAYEAWNEITSKYVWQGTPEEIAEMTKILYDVVKQYDPTARVVSANHQTAEQMAWFRGTFPKYMAGLAARGWPVDAVAIHTYAGGPRDDAATGLIKRVDSLTEIMSRVRQAQIPARVQIWDTETNYLGKATVPVQHALLSRTYLDSWRFGIQRTYWYYWVTKRDPWLGVHLEPGAPAVATYNRLAEWTIGATFQGCYDKAPLTVCGFQRGTERFQIAYAKGLRDRGSVPVPAPVTACKVSGSACTTHTTKVPVGFVPVRFG